MLRSPTFLQPRTLLNTLPPPPLYPYFPFDKCAPFLANNIFTFPCKCFSKRFPRRLFLENYSIARQIVFYLGVYFFSLFSLLGWFLLLLFLFFFFLFHSEKSRKYVCVVASEMKYIHTVVRFMDCFV